MLAPLAPEPVDALINFLKSDSLIVAISADRVSTIKIDTPLPRIQITMVPGPVTEHFEETTEFQLDCWGGTERQAKTLARTVCNRIDAMRGPLAGGAVTVAVPTVKPFDLPDPTTGRPRSVCQVAVTISPTSP
jgi:hypothetical protein